MAERTLDLTKSVLRPASSFGSDFSELAAAVEQSARYQDPVISSDNESQLDSPVDTSRKVISGKSSDSSSSSSRFAYWKANGQEQKQSKKTNAKRYSTADPSTSVHFHGINASMAASSGNFPIFVLLWGMAAGKRINLMVPDVSGNNLLHYASLADNCEVMNFILHQSKSITTSVPEIRLVDIRNEAGETPLHKAMYIGNLSIIKTLLHEGANPLIKDNFGNTLFIILCKQGHLWCLHFMFKYIRDKYGETVAMQHLNECDNEQHGVIEWAADSGSVNVLEYLLRRGLNLLDKTDSYGRNALYWAVKSNRVAMVRFLVKCGCDPYKLDKNQETPYQLAKKAQHYDILQAIKSNWTFCSLFICLSNHRDSIFGDSKTTISLSKRGIIRIISSSTTSQPADTTLVNVNDFNEHLYDPNLPSFPPLTTSRSGGAGSPVKNRPFVRISVSRFSSSSGHFENGNSSNNINNSSSGSSNSNSKQRNKTDDSTTSTSDSAERNNHAIEMGLTGINTSTNINAVTTSPRVVNTSTNTTSTTTTITSPRLNATSSSDSTSSSRGRELGRPASMNSVSSVKRGINVNAPIVSDEKGVKLVTYKKLSTSSFLCYWFSFCSMSDSSEEDEEKGKSNKSNKRYSHAISRINQTRLSVVTVYSLIFLSLWLATMVAPYYAWIVLVVGVVGFYRYFDKKIRETKDPNTSPSLLPSRQSVECMDGGSLSQSQVLNSIPTYIQANLYSSEKYVGSHMSLLVVYIFYWLCCFFSPSFILASSTNEATIYNDYSQPFSIGGLSGGKNDVILLYVIVGYLIVTILLYTRLAVCCCDPGCIDTRNEDFDVIMEKSLQCMGAPSSRYSCPTTLVIKPLRSKYDVNTGLLVARMDHYCIWLNQTIGFKNHRTFLCFLLTQLTVCILFSVFIIRALIREIGNNSIAENLVGSHYLFISAILVASIIVSIGLIILLFDQLNNILKNQTVNEKLNFKRYPWMVDEFDHLSNKFDRGWFHNFMEFCQLPRYYIDYSTLFELPTQINNNNNNTNDNSNNGANDSSKPLIVITAASSSSNLSSIGDNIQSTATTTATSSAITNAENVTNNNPTLTLSLPKDVAINTNTGSSSNSIINTLRGNTTKTGTLNSSGGNNNNTEIIRKRISRETHIKLTSNPSLPLPISTPENEFILSQQSIPQTHSPTNSNLNSNGNMSTNMTMLSSKSLKILTGNSSNSSIDSAAPLHLRSSNYVEYEHIYSERDDV